MGIFTRIAKRMVLLSGFGVAFAACTTPEPVVERPYYGGYYGYPPGYYYPPPAYESFNFYGGPSWWGSPWWDRPFPHRRFREVQPAPPPASAPRGGTAPAPGFLGNMMRPQPPAAPHASPGAPSGGGSPRGFLGNVLRERQKQGQSQ